MGDYDIFNVPESLITRFYSEPDYASPYRSIFMRDRDRIMYATAFRRLAGKTQIYTVGADDHKKNRLTHTLEVSQIARTIATALELNPDLAEAIALAHDFGHTPFGHAGEEILNQIMIPESIYVKGSPFYKQSTDKIKEIFEREDPDKINCLDYMFGFKHNLQSVRVCGILEDSYRGSKGENIGLNLSNYALYGIMIHSKQKYKEGECYPNFHNFFNKQMHIKNHKESAWSFEAYIVKIADDIAQWHHDLEDAIREGALPINKICDIVKDSLQKCFMNNEQELLGSISEKGGWDRRCISQLSHIVVNTLVNDLVETTKENFNKLLNKIKDKDENINENLFTDYKSFKFPIAKENIISFSNKVDTKNFKGIIREAIHHSRNVERMNEKGKYIIRKLFEAYYAHPQQLPDGYILHLMVDFEETGYENIDTVKQNGIGQARIEIRRGKSRFN